MSDDLRVVLVQPSHPGNVGAAARAMKTMGLSRLFLVDPARFPSAEATALASGADDVLAAATVTPDLDTALSGCRLVLGASARSRAIPLETLEPRACAARAAAEAARWPVALVFGRERTGLTNDELGRCHALVHIPCNPDYPSLNLAAAVQILAYEVHRARGGGLPPAPAPEHPPADAAAMEGLYAHFEQALTELGFLDPTQPRTLLARLRRLFQRARPDTNEINILRGILAAAQGRGRYGQRRRG